MFTVVTFSGAADEDREVSSNPSPDLFRSTRDEYAGWIQADEETGGVG